MFTDPQLGQTRGLWSRSAAINVSASAALYSLIPRRPTEPPFRRAASAGHPQCESIRAMAASANPREGKLRTFILAAALVVPGLFLEGGKAPSRAHTITLSGDPGTGQYRFSPGRISVRPGDTLEFVVESGGPHALGIDPVGLSAPQQEAWNRAMPRRVGELRGPLLRGDRRYAIVVPAGAEPGKVGIFCLSHRAYDMKLEVQVERRGG